jgi:hypothetical protein
MPNDGADSRIRVLVVGDPDSRRVSLFLETARQTGSVEATVISYRELLTACSRVERPARGTIVRIESPGGNADTNRLILKAGIEPMIGRRRVPIDERSIDEEPIGRGEIVHPLQWYLGFQRILQSLEQDWGRQGICWMSTPAVIATAFDKLACRERWQAAGIPVPPGHGEISTYADLRRIVRDRHARLFIKLRYGYSAMGAVALEWRGPLVRAITTVEVAWAQGRPRMFISKRPRTLHREFEIAWLIDTLGMEDVVVEDWLPKARWQGTPFDLRIVTIAAQARHVVGRANDSPFTNLNLDAARISCTDVAQRLGESWPEALSLAERAAAQLPEATTLGLDVLVRPCLNRFAVLEANAFGDYLPGLLYEGATTYEAELQSVLRSYREAA